MADSNRTTYDEMGYVVVRGLIPGALIDTALAEYRRLLLPSGSHFFRQSSGRWEKHQITAHGYIQQSILNVHQLDEFPSISDIARQVFFCPAVLSTLSELTGRGAHRLMQSMFFDYNAATAAHQDWYYLDSVPNGNLLAGWFALEDIEEGAGRFFVYPKTQRLDLDLTTDEELAEPRYLDRIKAYASEHVATRHAPALAKGDVLFWNSGLIHGSLPTTDARYSRKSFTAHYLPEGYEFGRKGDRAGVPTRYVEWAGQAFAEIPPEHRRYSLKSLLVAEAYRLASQSAAIRRVGRFVKRVLRW